jgi:O-antigen/teichoic acid export membrane protein
MYAQGKKQELERMLRTVATLAGIPAFLILVGFIFLGGPILNLMFGSYYRDGAAILALLSIGQLVNVWAGSCGITLMMTGNQVTMMVVASICGAITVGIGIMVVGQYGATGVATAAAASLVLQNILMWLGARFTTGIWTHVGFTNLLVVLRAARAPR